MDNAQAFISEPALDIGPQLSTVVTTRAYLTATGPQCDELCARDGAGRWAYVCTSRKAERLCRVEAACRDCHQYVTFKVAAHAPDVGYVELAHRRWLEIRERNRARADAANFERLYDGWRAFRIAALSCCVYGRHSARELAERLEAEPLRVVLHYVAAMRDAGLLAEARDENDENDWRIPYRTTDRGVRVLEWLRAQELDRFDADGELRAA